MTRRADSEVVDRCEQHDDSRCERLRGRKRELVRLQLERRSEMPCEYRIGNGRQKKSSKAQKPGGGYGGRARSHNHRTRPAKQKPPHRAEPPTEINIVAACFRHGRAKLGVAQSS